MCDWAITVVLFALGLAGGRAAEAVPPAELSAPDLTPTFTHRLIEGGDEIAFPVWCQRVQGEGAPVPIPCRPALFGADSFSTGADASAFVVVPFPDDGCDFQRDRARVFDGAFALIKRGACPFVKKALSAQSAVLLGF